MSKLALRPIWLRDMANGHFVQESMRATQQVTDRLTYRQLCPINSLELAAIRTLSQYVANKQHTSIMEVHTLIEREFSVESITKIRSADYDDVMNFLVEICS